MLELVVIGATLALAAGASGAQLHRRTVAARALAQYATSRRHVFVPAPSKPRGASPRVEGEREDVAFVIDLYRLGGMVRTRVAAAVVRGHLPKVSVVQRGKLARTFAPRSALEGAYELTTETPDDAEAVRHHAGEALLVLAHREDVWLASDGTRVSLSWQGIETNPLVLDAARDAVTSFATLHVPRCPYR